MIVLLLLDDLHLHVSLNGLNQRYVNCNSCVSPCMLAHITHIYLYFAFISSYAPFLTDVNECDQPGVCDVNAQCVNVLGSYECRCGAGYMSLGDVCIGWFLRVVGILQYLYVDMLTDIDECESSYDCALHARCTNTEGSYTCSCTSGYEGDGFVCGGMYDAIGHYSGSRLHSHGYCCLSQM